MSCLYTVTKRGAENVKATKNTTCWCKCFLADSLHKNWKHLKTISDKKLKPSTFRPLPHFVFIHFPAQRNPKASWGFPTNILLRGHGPVCSVHPRPPSPPGAAGVASLGCQEQRCCASGAAARGQATGRTQPNEGEKFSKNFVHLKSQRFGKFWPLKNPPWT